jgi:subtilisin family serine protease
MLDIRRSLARSVAVGASLLAIAACSEQAPLAPRADASRPQASQSALAAVAATRRLVAVRDASSANAVAAHVHALGGTVTRSHAGAGIVVATGLSDAAASALARDANVVEVLKDRAVQWVAPRVFTRAARSATPAQVAAARAKHQLTGPPDDQSGAVFFPEFQWNMRVIRASDAWLLNNRHGDGAIVCALDTGIDPNHLDLTGKVDLGISTSMVVTEPDILDYNGHGTFVSSQIATNGIGMASVAPLATLCQVKVLSKTGAGLLSDGIAGVVYAADAGADVINMSFGAYFTTKDPDFALIVRFFQRAVDYANHKGVTVVASAGNGDSTGVGIDLATDPKDLLEIPAQLQHVISVGATAPHAQQPGTFDDLTSYTNYGYPGVDVFAPGGDFVQGDVIEDLVLGACSGLSDPGCADEETYALGAGTSFAAPLAAGEAAILQSDTRKQRKPLDKCIIRSADPLSGHVPDPITGFGRIDVLAGIQCHRIE